MPMHTANTMQAKDISVLKPIYDCKKTYAENVQEGPFFRGNIPHREWPEERQWIDFMGFRVASPLGVPAGPLLTSRWVALAAKLGFDIVTYKTIRSAPFGSHPLPNVIFVDAATAEAGVIRAAKEQPAAMADISITNSFGNPSMPRDFLMHDISAARSSLSKGQVLIVSVFGSPEFAADIQEDFVQAALLAKEAGAHIIEANFSCPNLNNKAGCIYADPENSHAIAAAMVKAISPVPLLVKMGRFYDKEQLRQVLIGLAKAGVRGICGINTVAMKVVNEDGSPALGAERPLGGICGNAIRGYALDFLRQARELITQEKLGLEMAGCGGIASVEHFDDFLKEGVQAALTATGMMWDPYLASKWHAWKKESNG